MKKLILLFSLLTLSAHAAGTVGTVKVAPFSSGSRNYVKNPSARLNSANTSTSSASIARVTTAGNKIDGFGSFTCDSSATSGYCEWALDTIETPDDSGNCEFSGQINGDGSLYSAQILDGSSNVLNSVALGNVSAWTGFQVTYPCGSSRKVRITQTTAGTAPALGVGRLYYGKLQGLGSASQATLVGGVVVTGCAGPWTTSSTSLAQLGSQTGCVYTAFGSVSSPSTNIAGFNVSALAPGEYTAVYDGQINQPTQAKSATWKFHDGTGYAREQSAFFTNTGGSTSIPGPLNGTFSYNVAQTNVTFSIWGSTDSGGAASVYGTTAVPGTFKLYRFPSQSEVLFRSNQQTAPTIQKFTSGSGTYTTPVGVTSIRVRMVGGGGGGSGGGSSNPDNATAGGNTTFGSSLLVANGGARGASGSAGGGAGGSATLGTGPIGTALAGGSGSGYAYQNNSAGGGFGSGGVGGSSAFGGGGGGQTNGAGLSAAANTGGGGGGGGQNAGAAAGTGGGNGGGAGGFVDAIINGPASSYSYSVGTGGSGGAAGTSGSAGGGGGSGYIEVTEYYGAFAPVLIGSVTSNSTGSERIERAMINATSTTSACTTSPCSITSQSGNWISSVTRTGTGGYTINFTSGIFSAAPTCSGNFHSSPTANAWIEFSSASTSSIAVQSLSNSSTPVDTGFSVICMGPR